MKKLTPYYFKVVFLMQMVLLLGFPLELMAQDIDSTATPDPLQKFTLDNTKSGVRSTALGNASVADYTELSSVYINPAVLSFVKKLKRVEFNSSQNWDNQFMLQNFTTPFLAYNRHRASLQTGLLHKGFGSDKMPASGLGSTPNLTMYRFDLAYAFLISPSISFGVLNSTSIAQNPRSNKAGSIVSFGMLYAPSKSVSYGLAFRGLGRNIGYMTSSADSIKTELMTRNATESLELGATLNYPVDTDRTYFSLSIANEKRFGDPGIWYKMGLEVNLNILPKLPQVHVRNGLIMQPEFEIYAPTFGLGMDFEKYSVSFAMSPGTQLQHRFHQLGVIIHFDKF